MDNDSNNDSFDYNGMQPIEAESRGRPLIWALLGGGAIGCGILFAALFFLFQPDAVSLVDRYFPSPTPTATATPNWTATAQAVRLTATAQAIQTTVADASSQWKVWFTDPFDSNTNNWSTGEDDDEWATIHRTIENGIYILDVASKKGFIGWVGADTGIASDFYLAVDIQQSSGSTSDTDYGLTFREDSRNNFYNLSLEFKTP